MFLAYLQCIVSPLFYGASLFLMKEEDMALTARANKGASGGGVITGTTYHQHANALVSMQQPQQV
jgi:hypothetical protein